MFNFKLFNLDLVKVAQEARASFRASEDAWKELNSMTEIFSSVYDAKRDVWFSSFNRGMQLDASLKAYFGSLKWRAA